MAFSTLLRRIATLLAVSALLLGVPVAAYASSASSATTGTGWIRLAHLSPNTPPVDVYLYSFGNSSAQIVLHHVAYGTVSPYEAVTAGDYSVAMRASGASATSAPVLSTSVTIKADHAYTVAGLGPESGLRLEVLNDDLTTPPGKSLVRVIEASLNQQTVKVTYDGKTILPRSSFASVSSYQEIAASSGIVAAVGGSGTATQHVTFAAGTVRTLVVADGADGLELMNLEDAAGAGKPPVGSAQTGFGGTAPRGPGSPLPWAALIGIGSLLALASALRLRHYGLGRHELRRRLRTGV